MPIVSVIIPVFNAEKRITKTLNSIFDQTFKNFEIIAVNDGSKDKSQKILEQYKDRITIVKQPNQGAPRARNTGAKLAQGKFIIFIDDDITLRPNMLEKMVTTMQKNKKISFVYSSFKFGNKTFRLWPFNVTKLKQMPYIHTASLIRKDHFPGFDKKLKRFQDWDLWLTMLDRGYTGKFIPEVLFSVKAGGSMSKWLPKGVYKLPFLKQVQKYKEAEKIIKAKHRL